METIGTSAAASIASVEPVLIVVGGAIIALAAVALGIRWVKANVFLIDGGFGLPFLFGMVNEKMTPILIMLWMVFIAPLLLFPR